MLHYITSNAGKIRVANKYLMPLGLEVVQKELDLIEIQSHSIEEITKNKAEQAYAKLQAPLLVNDAGWEIHALNGFPGPYMRYINEWFTVEDFLNLMKDKTDRRVTFTEYFCYRDESEAKVFTHQKTGTVLLTPHGTGKLASWSLISLREDGKSIAQSWEEGIDPSTDYTVWTEIAAWYRAKLRIEK